MGYFLGRLIGFESKLDRELRNQAIKISYKYKPAPRKTEFEIMGKMLNDAETYDTIKHCDLRDKTLTMLREYIEINQGKEFNFKTETTESNTGTIETTTYHEIPKH